MAKHGVQQAAGEPGAGVVTGVGGSCSGGNHQAGGH